MATTLSRFETTSSLKPCRVYNFSFSSHFLRSLPHEASAKSSTMPAKNTYILHGFVSRVRNGREEPSCPARRPLTRHSSPFHLQGRSQLPTGAYSAAPRPLRP